MPAGFDEEVVVRENVRPAVELEAIAAEVEDIV
jgi:hypothetical protein